MKEKVIIFGTGIYFKKKAQSIKENYEIEAFLDNAVKPGMVEEKDGMKVYNPQMANSFGEYKIVLASSKWFEMWKQLMGLKVNESRIIFGSELKPFADTIEEIFYDEQITISSKDRMLYLKGIDKEYIVSDENDYKAFVRRLFAKKNSYIKLISNMPIVPVSKHFGAERGTAIDRFYIEKFLSNHQKYIYGTIMEIADNYYTKMFAKNITKSIVLHINGWGEGVIRGDLSTGEGIIENSVDCLICTQTIQFIYDMHSVVKNIYKLLKPGGIALLTAAATSQLSLYDYKNWGEYWRFTDKSMKELLQEAFMKDKIEVYVYGNMKSAIAFMYGICQEEMEIADLEYQDEQFPMIVAAVARKG